jgi:hypothetical protein
VFYETSFDSKQPKLEQKQVLTLSKTRFLFRLFRFHNESTCFGVLIKSKQKKTNRNKQKKTNRINRKQNLQCCSSKDHLINRKEPGFKQMLEDSLAEIKKSTQELIHGKKIRAFCVLSPHELLSDRNEDTEDIKFWDTDPVHLTPEGYNELVGAIAAAATTGEYERIRNAEPNTAPAPAKLPAKLYHRQKWVKADDVTAHRIYNLPRGQGNRARGNRGFPPRHAHAQRGGPSFSRGRGRGHGNCFRPY